LLQITRRTSALDPEHERHELPASSCLLVQGDNLEEMELVNVPRSRRVGQSYVTSVLTTLRATLYSFWVVWRHQPQVVSAMCFTAAACVSPQDFISWTQDASNLLVVACLCASESCSKLLVLVCVQHYLIHLFSPCVQLLANGPGTCLPLCLAAFVLR
jgi:hypothetical protein